MQGAAGGPHREEQPPQLTLKYVAKGPSRDNVGSRGRQSPSMLTSHTGATGATGRKKKQGKLRKQSGPSPPGRFILQQDGEEAQ